MDFAIKIQQKIKRMENKDMKIELIRLKFDDTHSYKYKPFKYCCDEIQKDKTIVFTGEDINYICGEYEDDGVCVPQFCTSYTETVGSWGDELEQTDNYPIQFCPHCGEKIEISVVEEIDVSDKYNKLSKRREELWKGCQRTDSKKKEFELREQIGKLDKQINGFYELGKMEENNNV